jgi:hypothetical protein
MTHAPIAVEDASRLRSAVLSPARLATALALIAGALGLWLARPAPLTAVDQEQPRLNQAAPAPRGGSTIGQTFVAAHQGLSGIEVLAVVGPNASSTADLTLRLSDADGRVIAAASYAGVAHNSPLRLSFSPMSDSAERAYTLTVEGGATNSASVWAYGLDGYAPGALLVEGAPTSGDLRFSTTYTYLWAEALNDLMVMLGRLVGLALPLWLMLFAPGTLVLQSLPAPDRRFDSVWVRGGVALGLSLSLLPAAWLWVTTTGLRWSANTLAIAYGVTGIVVIGKALIGLRRHLHNACAALHPAGQLMGGRLAHHSAMLVVVSLSLGVRLLAVRDLAFPQWVDSPHHLTIVRLLAEAGRVPDSYRPVLPIDRFSYHFGFHTLAAAAHWLTPLSLPDVLLLLGQILNGLAPLAVYAFVACLTSRPRAGLVAAFFVGLVSLFPAYYVSWGRYTQLTGVLILAPALAVVWSLIAERERSDESPAACLGRIALAGVLVAGLLLTHYRVFVFLVTFVLIVLAGSGAGGRKRVLLAMGIGAVLAFPWLMRLAVHAVLPVLRASNLASPAGYNAFPLDYFQRGLERGWILAALLAMGWGLMRRERSVWTTAGWVGLTFALLNIGPGTWVVNNNAWAITLFVPGALLMGWGADRWLTLADALIQAGATWFRRALGGAMLAGAAGLAAFAGWQGLFFQISVSNPATVLATSDDARALDWIEQHLPDQAVFLVNGWEWLNGTWAGSDGGIWIWPLTGRQTTLPTLDYAFQSEWGREVSGFNERVASISEAGAPETLSLLRDAGVTHVYIGAKGGTLRPEMFSEDPNYRLLYTNGAAWIFGVQLEGED